MTDTVLTKKLKIMTLTNEHPTNLKEMLFDVEKVQVTEFDCNSDYAYDIYGYPNDVKTRLNSCSNRYELVPNEQIFPVIRQILINKGINFSENYSQIDNARFYGEYIIEDQRFAHKVNGSNDIIKPIINVQHSYNGLTKYKIQFGYFRLICTNGLVIPVEEMKEYNLSIVGKHTKSILNSFDQLNNTLNYFVNNADQITLAITAKYDTLAGNWVAKWEDRIEEVLNVNKISIVDGTKNTLSHIKSTVNSEKHLFNNKVNDWLIYNAINRYIYDDSINIKAPEVRRELDSKVFESMLS